MSDQEVQTPVYGLLNLPSPALKCWSFVLFSLCVPAFVPVSVVSEYTRHASEEECCLCPGLGLSPSAAPVLVALS